MTVSGCSFTECAAVQQAGAVYHNNTAANTVTVIQNCTFTDCSAGNEVDADGNRVKDDKGKEINATGGALESDSRDITITGCKFLRCISTKNAGAISIYARRSRALDDTRAVISDCTFKGCKGNSGKYYYDYNGGSIRCTSYQTEITDCTFEPDGTNAASNTRGGAIALTNRHSDSTATINGCTISNTKATYMGGAIFSTVGTLTVGKSDKNAQTTITNCEATGYAGTNVLPAGGPAGGAIAVAQGNAILKEVTIEGCTSTKGGAVYVGYNYIENSYNPSTLSMTCADTVIQGNTATNGGAIYVAGTNTMEAGKSGSTEGIFTLTNGKIIGNTATGDGAGIYLEEGSTLELSGSPDFGGDDLYTSSDTIPEGKAVGDIKGTDGNFIDGILDAYNGLKAYTKARQDIYVEGYLTSGGSAVNAESIVVTGALGNAPGTIWVACEIPGTYDANNHYEMLTQFAVFDDALVSTTSGGETSLTIDATDTYLAFRNAQTDADTGCSSDYLTGTAGQTLKYINWTGGFDFSFLKIDSVLKTDGNVQPLAGATFALYKQSKDSSGNLVTETVGGVELPVLTVWKRMIKGTNTEVTAVSADGTDAYQDDDKNTLALGTVFFSKLPPATYYMVETLTPGQLTADQIAAGGISTYADNNVTQWFL